MAKGKGYKLTSAATDGMPKTCAFFFSDKGCRNGANCKFSHDKPQQQSASASVSSSSVVSSESESDGEVIEKQAGAYASLGSKSEVDIRGAQQQQPECVNPFLTAVNSVPTPAVVTNNAPTTEVAPVVVEKKKKKRKKSKESVVNGDGNIFDLGKANNDQTPASSPTKNNVNGTAAILESVAAVVAPPAKKAKKQQQQAAAVVVVAPPVKKEKQQQQQQQQHPTKATNTSATPSFRNLQLPIASFSLPTATTAQSVSPSANKKARPPSPQHEPAPDPPPLPLPTATPAHLKWKSAVQATQSHVNFTNAFNYDRAQQLEQQSVGTQRSNWITSRPYDKSWAASNPASIAIDCEMCETKDPISGNVDTKALCRISIVNGDNPSEVLLDTLVKPQWPVTKYRTFVNGITEDDLKDVQFTLQHAQTFMQALCSNQTVIIGHAVHNDLLALKMIHYCVCDTALLYKHVDADDGTPSLKNLAFGVLKREMPNVHDSVNDARVALECAQHYVTKNGIVDGIEKVYSRSNSSRTKLTDSADTAMLLVHRLPTSTQPQHISEMFVAYTYVKPKSVADINFSGNFGKCHVEFTTMEHAELAYMSLVGDEREDKTGKKQKRVGLKGGGYVCVRKMKKE